MKTSRGSNLLTDTLKPLAVSLSAGVDLTYIESHASNALHRIADIIEESCCGLTYEIEGEGNTEHENAKDFEAINGFVAMIRQQAEDKQAG